MEKSIMKHWVKSGKPAELFKEIPKINWNGLV